MLLQKASRASSLRVIVFIFPPMPMSRAFTGRVTTFILFDASAIALAVIAGPAVMAPFNLAPAMSNGL
jgi:hypothetical protein